MFKTLAIALTLASTPVMANAGEFSLPETQQARLNFGVCVGPVCVDNHRRGPRRWHGPRRGGWCRVSDAYRNCYDSMFQCDRHSYAPRSCHWR